MMVLLLHVVIALSGLISSTLLYLDPTKKKLFVTYSLVGATFATGFYLVLKNPSHLVSSCVMGLIYLGVSLAAIFSAKSKLATTN
jgi:hypothetical protein